MQKRGISHHLDWIIGITLFMFFVVFVIATIKPGVLPLHKKDVLLNIIQNKFIENVTWEIQRVPLTVESPGTISSLKKFGEFNFPFDWNSDNTRLYNKSNQEFEYSITSNKLCVDLFHNDKVYDGELFILHSNEEIFEGLGLSSCPVSETGGNIVYGVPETLTGLSQDKIDNLISNPEINYNIIKTNWKYPETSDFNITVNLKGHIFEISSGKESPSNAEVYVKQYTDFILDKDGEKIPATVTIKAW